MKKHTNNFWITIGIGTLVIILLILVSSILTIGDKLKSVHEYAPLVFYILSGILSYILFVRPVVIILAQPSFNIPTTLDKMNKKNIALYTKVAKKLIKDGNINSKSVENLQAGLRDKSTLLTELTKVYNNDIKKVINKVIVENSKTVLVSTAISQNGKFDMFTVLAVNFKMVREIVELCGFKPSYKNLAKLSLNVLGTALISEGLENIDFNELFPNASNNFLNEIPFLKVITSSIVNGISNGLLTARIGIITRKYLFNDSPIKSKTQIRVEAFKEGAKLLPSIIKNSLDSFPNKIRDLFVGKNKIKEEME